jgi:hypothetical protein
MTEQLFYLRAGLVQFGNKKNKGNYFLFDLIFIKKNNNNNNQTEIFLKKKPKQVQTN